MFECRVCGNTFDGKDPHPFRNAMRTECPRCGSDRIEEVCAKCGRAYVNDSTEFFGNYCRECLMQKLTYKTGHDFLLDSGYLVDFVFDRLFGTFVPIGDEPKQKQKTEALASKLFELKVCDDLVCDDTIVMQSLIEYIFDDDAMFGETFAEWVETKGGGME